MDDKQRKKWERAVEDALWQISALLEQNRDSRIKAKEKLYQILHRITAMRLK